MDSRRRLVVKGLVAGTAATLVGCNDDHVDASSAKNPPLAPPRGTTGDGSDAGDAGAEPSGNSPDVSFVHGVASGDPWADRVILWTRVTPRDAATVKVPVVAIVASDPAMQNEVGRYPSHASAESDYTVKIDAGNLVPNRWYYYQFAVGDQLSDIGRTRTLPAADAAVDRARFALLTCSQYPDGYFSVYRMVAEQADLDFVVHVGDYIYEYGRKDSDVPGRDDLQPPHETVSLQDYRERYAFYRQDEDLQAVHRQFPMIVVWDDHETANNSYTDGAQNHDPEDGEGAWPIRKARAQQAYFEWLPIREQEPGNFNLIYRRFAFGDLIDLSMLDTRLEGRDKQVGSQGVDINPARNDPDHNIISETQMQWLLSGLSNSMARWRFVGQQVMFAQLNVAELPSLNERQAQLRGSLAAINPDQWDGYAADRLRILNHISDNGINNVVVLAGDIHSSWASEIYRNPASLLGDLYSPPLATEFVTPSITSAGLPNGAAQVATAVIGVIDPHIRYLEGQAHGFVLMDVDRQRVQAEYYYATDITSKAMRGDVATGKTKLLAVDSGDARLREDNLKPTRPRLDQPARAPEPARKASV